MPSTRRLRTTRIPLDSVMTDDEDADMSDKSRGSHDDEVDIEAQDTAATGTGTDATPSKVIEMGSLFEELEGKAMKKMREIEEADQDQDQDQDRVIEMDIIAADTGLDQEQGRDRDQDGLSASGPAKSGGGLGSGAVGKGDEAKKKEGMFSIRRVIMMIGFLLAATVYFTPIDRDNYKIQRTACVTLLMATCWVTEAIPLAVTAFFPVVLFPLMEVESGSKVSSCYFNNVVFILLGGFIVAMAMERWGFHKRIAMFIIKLCGVRPRFLLLGMMLSTWFLSLWISNTATTLMMIPNALAVVKALEEQSGSESNSKAAKGFSDAVFLGIAYSANIGGVGTLIGTPPNMIFAELVTILFPGSPAISFAKWFMFAMPLSFVLMMFCWVYLSLRYAPTAKQAGIGKSVINTDLPKMSIEEKVMMASFISLALLWFFRADLDVSVFKVSGWSNLFRHPDYITDGTVAMTIGVLLFMIPARSSQLFLYKENCRRDLEHRLNAEMPEETDPVEEMMHRDDARRELEASFFKGKFDAKIMDWETTSQLPWELVILFGGGFALAEVFQSSGLSGWLGGEMQGLGSLPTFFLIFFICLGTTWLTEVTSNTAITQLLLPIMASIAVAIRQHPYFLMIAATTSASFCYMMPVGTPPNLAVFSSKRVTVQLMFKTGIVMNIVSVILNTIAVITMIPLVFGCSPSDFPAWAEPTK
eukprot:TRINITY_DN19687_c0_g1_i1.p1 TRINITY_DN19687_c0_g1~~TRINITY_DN19687_c0_g1_i1.p1  ORF type:complete len:700 (+),score=186.61 TRINITY_DN19687_c0_g1_i1:106-2205(+)